MTSFIIELNNNGSFPNSHDKVYFLYSHDHLTITLDSVKIQHSIPILLTNYPELCSLKKTYHHPKAPQITQLQQISSQQLEKQYKCFHGFYNSEGSWQIDLQIQDFDGSLFLQVIFVSLDYIPGQKSPIDILSYADPEWIMIQPRNTMNSSVINLDELVIQTVLPFSLGNSSKWLDILKSQTQLGYNGFHFPPIQKLGFSGSYYSINDQLKPNQELFSGQDFEQIYQIVSELQKQTKAVCFVDILLNHTSFDSEWLIENSDGVYNNTNTPSLCSAIELDEAISQFSDKLAQNEIKEYRNGSNKIENDEQLDEIIEIMKKKIFYFLKLEEYFLFDYAKIRNQFEKQLASENIQLIEKEMDVEEDENIFSKSGFAIMNDYIQLNAFNIGAQRLGVSICLKDLVQGPIKKAPKQHCFEALERAISYFNQIQLERVKGFIEQAIQATRGQIKYWHVEQEKHEVTLSYTIVPRYFTKFSNGTYAANNGWIMNYDPLKNFADDNEFHYLRRNLVVWGDLVKLRYGNSKKDAPFLWKRMKKYVQEMARVFHGFRLDNAHSTPLHVGEYFMRKARNQNKNLMIFAELFTGDTNKDALFCKKIGINALVRETNNNKSNSDLYNQLNYLSRVQQFSVGSLERAHYNDIENGQKKKILMAKQPKSIVYDQTHDNESILSQFSLQQTLPLVAIISFSTFIKGTVKGFDELYPEKLSVVSERRKYLAQLDCTEIHLKDLQIDVVITIELYELAKNVEIRGDWDGWAHGVKMNLLSQKNQSWVYIVKLQVSQPGKCYEYKFNVDGVWQNDNTKQIRNGNNFFETGEQSDSLSYSDNLCIARKHFNGFNITLANQYPYIFYQQSDFGFFSIMREDRSKESCYFLISRTAFNESDSKVDVQIECPGIIQSIEAIYWMKDSVEGAQKQNNEFLQGLKTRVYKEHNILKYADIRYNQSNMKSILHFYNAPPSLSIVVKCTLHSHQKQAILQLNEILEGSNQDKIQEIYSHLSTNELNFILFSCEQEEKEKTGFGMYDISHQGKLLFGGLAAVFHDVYIAQQYNDLGKNIFHNLREGYWYLDYTVNRLLKQQGNLIKVAEYFTKCFDLLKIIPKYLIPTYFLNNKKLTSQFHTNLLLANYQFLSDIPSNRFDNYTISMAAGLPHFTIGWTRCWGRDTFIAFRGNLLIPGLYQEANQIICMFGSTLRHGLIPNLLDSGRSPRYNCRDGCWWWIKAVKDYIEFSKDSAILKQEINMQFLSDDMLENSKLRKEGKNKKMNIQDIIQDIFTKHAQGIKFREWRAGLEIDSNMDTEGFNIQLKMNENTGFIVGGNDRNCLTWMDKMGSSMKSGNKGVPGSSRDGAPIEMTALLKCCLEFVINCKDYEYKDLLLNNKKFTFKNWAELIQQNFEKQYWIPLDYPTDKPHQQIIIRRGIYKDLCDSKNLRSDYLLRPNACIAISVAPELFDLNNALVYLNIVQENLIDTNSIGVKTLDPQAPQYVPYYDNADDSVQPKTAHGFSYHNGPEWVWVYGYFVKALLETNLRLGTNFTKERLMSYLSNHKRHIKNDVWQSLPEITDQDGNYCRFSCPSQAWSIATLLEVCYDSDQLGQKGKK